ncbi:aldehyde dehydrogenase family protein [Chryseolinea sp. T2]|uniref:aldehyde dehydrogenase family protein n=1 Tax=Chryseolinea sp. T2 TaxID=3129255 RepID=UPI0030774679
MANIISPLDETVIGEITYANGQDVVKAIDAATKALTSLGNTSIAERADYLRKIHDEIILRIDDLMEATIIEYGATRERARWSNVISATTFQNQIAVLEKFEFVRTVNESRVILEPIGVTALFTPWNSVAGSIAVKLASALAAGCAVVLKPSEQAPRQAEIIMECIDKAGLPAGVVNMVIGRGDLLIKPILESRDVNHISFTGSTVIGKLIAKQAIDTMKRVTLELGGKSANIILEDADLTRAIPMAIQAAFMNNGQACIAGSRLLAPESKREVIVRLLQLEAGEFTVGNPITGDFKMGPLASKRQYDRIQEFIQQGIAEGAELIAGGPGRPHNLPMGYYVQPTIFAGVSNSMRIAREEIFGPVLSVIFYKNEEEAIAIANDSDYGLMAYVSTRDNEKAQVLAKQLKAGRVLINTLKHDPLAPFGGYKNSGWGRENGNAGMEEYMEMKAIIE